MNLAIDFATNSNCKPQTKMNQVDIDDLCDDGSVDSRDTLDREANTDKYSLYGRRR